MSHVAESAKIIVVSIGAAVLYGIAHDQVTARVCLEYFTVAHPDVVGHEPTIIALYWGVIATWWVGLPLGVLLAIASRIGERRPWTMREMLPRIARFSAGLLVVAMATGLVGYLTGELEAVAPHYVTRIPREHHAAFLFDVYAHSMSYFGGALGGVTLALWTYRSRPLA